MNNFHSDAPRYYPRWLTPLLQAASAAHPVVVLTGARQVGKSTLLRRAEPFAGWRYHTMDDFDTLRQVRENPASLWAGAHEVVLDEVQKAPALLPAIKRAVDEHPGRYRFILSGSANLLLMGNVRESLAGRAVYLTLDPLTRGEYQGQPPPALLADVLDGRWPEEGALPEALPDALPIMQRGFMPTLKALRHRRRPGCHAQRHLPTDRNRPLLANQAAHAEHGHSPRHGRRRHRHAASLAARPCK